MKSAESFGELKLKLAERLKDAYTAGKLTAEQYEAGVKAMREGLSSWPSHTNEFSEGPSKAQRFLYWILGKVTA